MSRGSDRFHDLAIEAVLLIYEELDRIPEFHQLDLFVPTERLNRLIGFQLVSGRVGIDRSRILDMMRYITQAIVTLCLTFEQEPETLRTTLFPDAEATCGWIMNRARKYLNEENKRIAEAAKQQI